MEATVASLGQEMLPEIGERMRRRFAPGTAPAEPAGFAVGKRHACDRSGAVRPRDRVAVEIDRLVEAAAAAVGAHLPPQGQGLLE